MTFFFLKDFIYLFLEKGREKEGEKNQCVVPSHVPPTGDLASNPGMCPRLGIEWATLWFTAGAQSTETHQPGQMCDILDERYMACLDASSEITSKSKCCVNILMALLELPSGLIRKGNLFSSFVSRDLPRLTRGMRLFSP